MLIVYNPQITSQWYEILVYTFSMSENGEHGELGFQRVPLFGSHVIDIDKDVPQKGLPLAIKDHFQELGIHIVAEQNPTTKAALERDPVLVIGTHPELMNGVVGITGSLPPERRDVFVTSDVLLSGLGHNIEEHLIPIHGVAHGRLMQMAGNRYTTHHEHLSPMQMAKTNVENLKIAAEKIKEGGIVVFFPDADDRQHNGDWSNGVGDIVERVADVPNAKVVFAVAKGDKWRNHARVASSKAREFLGPTELHVRYSSPHAMAAFQFKDGSRKTVTDFLKRQYDQFLLGGADE